MKRAALFFVSVLALGPLSCLKADQTGKRASGQSRLMDQTFAGQNACNPDNHLRPFIIEWDATDMSSFEAIAANDIVVVRYEGCSLTVLEECRNDSIRGSQGSYKPPEWTSGSLETIDISNEGELYAKLPLGSASLGGRVSGGEKFHMEYYVAGTRTATRDAVYTADLADNPGCEGATHFVYGYNLGAFALGSAAELNTTVGGSVYGFGAGGSTSSKNSAEKKGGDLATCKSDSATEVQGCKAPIRLTLRKIREGENPEQEAMRAPDTEESLNAAGALAAKLEMSDEAKAHADAAVAKMNSGDGKGCLKELDAHAKLDPKNASTNPSSVYALFRSQCLMQAGKCDAGKQLARQYYEKTSLQQYGPEQIDRTVDGMVSLYCQGKMSDRDRVLAAFTELSKGANITKKDPKFCKEHHDILTKLGPKVKPKDEEDWTIVNLEKNVGIMAAMCYGRAGDCATAYKVYVDFMVKDRPDAFAKTPPDQLKEILRPAFESTVPKCKGK